MLRLLNKPPSNKTFTTGRKSGASGQQQVRNIWINLAVYNLNLWMHSLVELWAWSKSGRQLVDRRD